MPAATLLMAAASTLAGPPTRHHAGNSRSPKDWSAQLVGGDSNENFGLGGSE